jgi:transposase InsO family protein
MNITMNDNRIINLSQVSRLTKGLEAVDLKAISLEERYGWLSQTLSKFSYFRLRKKERGILLTYCSQMTGLSRRQLKRLIRRKKLTGRIERSQQTKHSFPRRYTAEDIALLILTDNLHLRLSGKATKKIMEREFNVYGCQEYERISHISVSHLYNLRGTRQYQSGALYLTKTRATTVAIGVRKKPQPLGKPGFLRVDSVHQGDLGKIKGVYHINLVDEVTQWEIVCCVEGISEYFLLPALKAALELFPFRILGFHSDNGSEYINQSVAWLLAKMLAEQTKSRSRRTNDNALVESKNGSVVRKHFGYVHIPRKYAVSINRFQREWFSVYLNFHRPSGFATQTQDKRGKITKRYNTYLTPFERLKSLPDAAKYLKAGITMDSLEQIAHRMSDNEFARLMKKEKEKLSKTLT